MIDMYSKSPASSLIVVGSAVGGVLVGGTVGACATIGLAETEITAFQFMGGILGSSLGGTIGGFISGIGIILSDNES